MSFASPLWLLGLLLIPLAIAATIRARRRAKRYAVRFPAVSTLQRAVERGTTWQRVLPAAFALAAIAALAFALARPHVSYSASVGRGVGDARHRSFGVDGGDGRRAEPTGRRRARRQRVHRPAAVQRARRRGRLRELARRRPGAGRQPHLGAIDHQRPGRQWRDGHRRRARARAAAAPRRGQEAPALGDRAALRRRREHR